VPWGALISRADLLSRSFFVGAFLPAFMGLLGLVLLAPGFLGDVFSDDRLAVRALAALAAAPVVAIALSALDPFLWAVLDGRILERAPLRRLGFMLRSRQARKFEELQARWSMGGPHDPVADRAYAAAAFRRFPPEREQMMPTAFGNALRAHEFASRVRWGLDVAVVGPRLTLLIPKRALSAQETARTTVNGYANSMVMAVLVGAAVGADRVVDGRLVEALVVASVSALLAAGLQRGAVEGVVELGVTLSSCVDLYRLRLYSRLGAGLPTSAEEERELARAINQLLAFGRLLPDELRDGRTDSS
jgi:hypothetical protein